MTSNHQPYVFRAEYQALRRRKGVLIIGFYFADTLGVINGIINEEIQAPYYPEFAVNNTYGIKAYDDSTYVSYKNELCVPLVGLNRLTRCF